MNTVSSLYELRPGVWRARVLFHNSLTPVEYFSQGDERYITARLVVDDICLAEDLVTNAEFQMELDHIALFGCRSERPSFETVRLSNEEIELMLDHGDRLLDEAIRKIEQLGTELDARFGQEPTTNR